MDSLETTLVFSTTAICDRFGCGAGWWGSLSITSLEHGQQILVVEARDAVDNIVDAQQPFVHDRPPAVSVTAPLEGTVARPDLQVTAHCTDDDPEGCKQLTVIVQASSQTCSGSEVARGISAIDQIVSLATYEGKHVMLCFIAQDSAGQRQILRRGVYVESSSQLVEVASVRGNILDVQSQRILSLETTETGNRLAVFNRGSGEDVMVATDVDLEVAFLAPLGVIFVERQAAFPYAHVVEWRDGILQDLGGANSSDSLKVSGSYAIWNNGETLYRRDLIAGTTITVSTDAGNWMNDVAVNGDVVYWGGSYDIYRLRDGRITQLTNDDTLWNTYVATDGANVVYRKHTSCCANQTYALALYGSDGGESLLAQPQEQEPSPGRDYLLRSSWIAFTRQGSSGVIQVWTRSPSGQERQISIFGTNSTIEALSGTGEVIYRNAGRLYLATSDATAIELDFTLGQVFWQDGQWHAIIGRSLFKVVAE